MGHLAIVNIETLEDVLSSGCISTRGNINKIWLKTTSDLFSDALCIRKGDLIFPWIIKGDSGKNLGFRYVLKAKDVAHYSFGSEYPIQIPVEEKIIEYSSYLSEDKALDLFNQQLLWNAIGKKSLGRGKSITHQTLQEDDCLTNLLSGNSDGKFTEICGGTYDYVEKNKISISESQNNWNDPYIETIEKINEYDRISRLNLNKLPWVEKNYFSYEKTLEAWICENIDGPKCVEFRKLFLNNDDELVWFGNYLPYGVQGSNIDFVTIIRRNDELLGFVIELKVGPTKYNGYLEICKQVSNYSNYIKKALKSFNVDLLVTPMVLTGRTSQILSFKPMDWQGTEIPWINYSIVNSEVRFERVL